MAQRRSPRGRATRIDGAFLRRKDPRNRAERYRAHLQLPVRDGFPNFEWPTPGRRGHRGPTVGSMFGEESPPRGRNRRPAMIHHRVDDLERPMAKLRPSGPAVEPRGERSEYRTWGWVPAPAGNRIDVREPPRRHQDSAPPLRPME